MEKKFIVFLQINIIAAFLFTLFCAFIVVPNSNLSFISKVFFSSTFVVLSIFAAAVFRTGMELYKELSNETNV